MFKLERTFYDPAQSQSGFAEIGAGAQSTGAEPTWDASFSVPIDNTPERPTKGIFSWLFPASPRSMQSGQPEPENALQMRPPGSMPNVPVIDGIVDYVVSPEFSRGAGRFVPNMGYVLTNPIGAGVVAMQRPQASYGPAGEYIDGAIFWTAQTVPTSVDLNGLLGPEQVQALVGNMNVQAMVRVG